MKTKFSNLFNFSDLDTDYFNDNQNKIELVNNISLTKKCEKHLSLVNDSFHKFDLFRRDKNFGRAIEVLKDAYIATFDLTEASSIKFGEFFRSTILESLISIRSELRYLSNGILKRKRFQSSYQYAGSVLIELNEMSKNKKSTVHKENNHFIENYQKRNVS